MTVAAVLLLALAASAITAWLGYRAGIADGAPTKQALLAAEANLADAQQMCAANRRWALAEEAVKLETVKRNVEILAALAESQRARRALAETLRIRDGR